MVWYELSKGVHTKDDGNRKYAYILNFFLRLIFFEKMFWITLFLVGEQSVKVKWKKHSSEYIFFVIEKMIHETILLNCSVKISIGVPQESWKKLSLSENLVSKKKIFFRNSFWTTFLSVGVQRTVDREEKIYFGGSKFSLKLVVWKNFDWFGMIHQWVSTRMMIIRKNQKKNIK